MSAESVLRDALRDIALGATMMIDAPSMPPALVRYAEEVRRVAKAAIAQAGGK